MEKTTDKMIGDEEERGGTRGATRDKEGGQQRRMISKAVAVDILKHLTPKQADDRLQGIEGVRKSDL
jgi:hypothetical protein